MSAQEQSLNTGTTDPRAPAAGARGQGRRAAIRRAERLARLMDDAYLDPLIGLLLPGAGDLITLAPSLYIVLVGWRSGVPKAVLARMLLNLALDTLAGSVPLIGDLFDLGYKANKRNAALLREHHGSDGGGGEARGWLEVGGAVLLLSFALLIPVGVLAGVLVALFG